MMILSEPVENEEEFWGDFLDFLDEEDGDFGVGSITCLVIFFLDLHMELEAFKKRIREREKGFADGGWKWGMWGTTAAEQVKPGGGGD